ncbi:MAG: aminoacyl-tRNA deacylase [Deltaproteobacteria bacterium]|nr:aminoacyl-tRNA deacylase [Deltaproteobacteria bacterium]
MAKEKHPITQAIRALKEHGASYVLRPYPYQEKGGTPVAARELGVEEHEVIKTLVMEDEAGNPFLILMHGDREVSTKNMARFLAVKNVRPCDPETANRHTGYVVGGISPFGTRKRLRIYVEASILDLPRIFINAGRRGLLAKMSPGELARVLKPLPVNVAV